MIKYSGAPAFIEILSEMKHYWVLKHEINTIDGVGGVCQTCTVQLDIKMPLFTASIMSIRPDRSGDAPSYTARSDPPKGGYSRFLEDALKKDPPTLPLWLSPTQVRIIPVSEEKHIDFCVGVARELKQHRIRVDVDERSEKMGWRIRAAEREWIPYIVGLWRQRARRRSSLGASKRRKANPDQCV